MILTGSAENLGRTNAHADWLSRFQAIPQADQAQENSQMADIISLFPTEKSCDEATLAAAVNNEETTIFLGLDASKENFFLVHNLEVLPKSRHQKKPLIRALHGFGESATVILLDFEEVIKRNQIHSASITSIRSFAGHAKISNSTFISSMSMLTCRGLVALPPFISSKLMALPDLAVDHVLAIVLKSIANYDKKLLEKEASVALAKKEAEKKKAKEAKPAVTGELVDDPIEEVLSSEEDEAASSDEDKTPLTIWASAKKASAEKGKEPSDKSPPSSEKAPTPGEAKDKAEARIPKKPYTPSSYTKCSLLLRFLWTAAWQLRFPDGGEEGGDEKKPFLPFIPTSLTVERAHLAWGKERHSRNSVGASTFNQQATHSPGSHVPAGAAPMSSPNPEHVHLARKTTNALESISLTFQELKALNGTSPAAAAVEKVHPILMRMIKRLCTTDGLNLRDPPKFFTDLSTATGKGGTGAILQWNLHMSLNNWNIRVSNGCITAIAKGVWCWDRANFPNNLSIFGFPRVTANDYAKGLGESSQNIHLRANIGNSLSEKDVKLLSHQGMSYTPDVGETIKQMKNFSKCLDSIIHPDSMLAVNFKGFIRNVEENEESYESCQAMDALFCLKLLYKVDMIRNRICQQCLVNEDFLNVDWNRADFYQIHAAVLDGNFSQLLPSNLSIPDSTATSNSPGKRNKAGQPPTSDDSPGSSSKKAKSDPKVQTKDAKEKGNLVVNTDWADSLKLTASENYHALLLKTNQLRLMPKSPGTDIPICGNYHISGRCYSACRHKGSHQKLTPELLKETEKWLKKCRSDAAP
jgi:hypothetical protein